MDEKKVAAEETVVDEEVKTEEKPAKKAKGGKKEEVERLKAELAAAQAEGLSMRVQSGYRKLPPSHPKPVGATLRRG